MIIQVLIMHNIRAVHGIYLQDICLRQEDCEPSRVDEALTYISYIGISVSIICLIIALLTLLIFK